MCPIYLLFFHNVCFFVRDKVNHPPPLFIVTTIFSITYLTILFIILSKIMRHHRCFKENLQ